MTNMLKDPIEKLDCRQDQMGNFKREKEARNNQIENA